MKMTQEEMKRYFLNESRDVSIAIENFVIDDSTTENTLSKAKSSAKKLIEKIDEYLESQQPKFKVGDYAVELGKYITKIEKIDENTLINEVLDSYKDLTSPSLKSLINATGIIVHTNLGRSF